MPRDIVQTFLRHFVYARTDFPLQLAGYAPARQLDRDAFAFAEIFAVGSQRRHQTQVVDLERVQLVSDMACRFRGLHHAALKRAEFFFSLLLRGRRPLRRQSAEIDCQRGQALRQVVVQFPGNSPALFLAGRFASLASRRLPLLLRHLSGGNVNRNPRYQGWRPILVRNRKLHRLVVAGSRLRSRTGVLRRHCLAGLDDAAILSLNRSAQSGQYSSSEAPSHSSGARPVSLTKLGLT